VHYQCGVKPIGLLCSNLIIISINKKVHKVPTKSENGNQLEKMAAKITYRFTLQPGSQKHTCPACMKKRFVRYLDLGTKKLLPPEFGKCDRDINCGYWLDPYKEGYIKRLYQQENENPTTTKSKVIMLPPPRPMSLIPTLTMQASLKKYNKNNFLIFLHSIFDENTVQRLITDYKIGTSKLWPGATVFWQIDHHDCIRTGKIMLYNPTTGKRVKYNNRALIQWAHKKLYNPDFNLQQCFFGEHLLKQYPDKPAAVCESEKTAIIAAGNYPQFLWLATGGLNLLSAKRYDPLKFRSTVLFPDLEAVELWQKKAQQIKEKFPSARIFISTYLQDIAGEDEKAEGLDLADYLTTYKTSNLTS
jgi:hypothetical protein